jgi:hypothetical protein
MSEGEEPEFICPRCQRAGGNPKYREFGYCGACHAYTGAQATVDEQGGVLPLYKVAKGGLMRCCTGALHAWVALHPGPWLEGMTVQCPHHESWVTAMRFDGQQWAWQQPKEPDAYA